MATRIFPFYCIVITIFPAVCIEGSSLKLGLGFLVLSPPKVIAQRNYPLLLNCSGYSDSGPLHISWYHQGSLVNDNYKQILNNGSLFIEKVTYQKKHGRRDDGNYTCLLRNDYGSLVSKPIQVVIARMSKTFLFEPRHLTTFEGGQARFTCQIYAEPPAIVTWFHNGSQIPQNESRYTQLPSGTLQIAQVSVNDAGHYHCLCTNIARQRMSSEAVLTVLPRLEHYKPPVFLNPPNSMWEVEKNSAVLECCVTGYPKPEVIWERKGQPIENDRAFLLGESNLYFPSVEPEDSGIYNCTAKSFDSDTGQSVVEYQEVSLTVYTPPKFTKIPESHVKPPAQTSRFECAVEGSPTPSVQWLKNGEPLYINGRIKLKVNNALVISQTVSTDSGIYQCIASNIAGVTMVAARLQVTASS